LKTLEVFHVPGVLIVVENGFDRLSTGSESASIENRGPGGFKHEQTEKCE
jgi:hypothetical protein